MMRCKNPRIAYVVSMINGLEAFIYREVEYLYKKGLRVILFATKFKENDIYSPKPDWEYYSFKITKVLLLFPFLLLKSPLKNLHILLEAIRFSSVPEFIIALYYSNIMKRLDIEKIHCHFGDRKLFIGYFCRKILLLPLSVTIHAHEFVTNPNFKMYKVALIACDTILAVSEQNRDILVKKYSVPREKIKVVRLFVNIDKYKNHRKKRILWVGRFVSEKRLDILLESIKILNRKDVELIIVGFGPDNPRRLALEKGVSSQVLIFNKMDERQLAFFYKSCDIFCISSEREGIPVVLAEAMASRLSVVSTDVGAVKELVKEGILVKPDDPAALANGLVRLLDDPELRDKMGKRNRRIVEEIYNIKNVDELYDIFTAT